MLSMTPYGLGYPWGQLGSAVLAVSHPISLCTPGSLADGLGWEAEESLTPCEHCSGIMKISLCYLNTVSSTNPKLILILATVRKINSITARASIQMSEYFCIHRITHSAIFKNQKVLSTPVRVGQYWSLQAQEQNNAEYTNINYKTAWMELKWASGRDKHIEMQLNLSPWSECGQK